MRTLRPPTEISDNKFVLVWDAAADTYILSLRDGRTYELGNSEDTIIYFRNVLSLEEIGQRAMDCARNFYTAIAIINEKRVFSAETEESGSEYNKLFQIEEAPIVIV